MQSDSWYDVVFEMDYPFGESSEQAYDTWARELRLVVSRLFAGYPGVDWNRLVRAHGHVKISLRVANLSRVGRVISFLVPAIASRAPADVSIHIHECPLVVSSSAPPPQENARNTQ